MAELKRVLGFWTILFISIGSIMGTGLFFGVSVASKLSGNASIFAWIIMTAIGVYISMYFAELVSMFPKAGGVYEFSKHAYNRFFSFMIGWIAWLVGNLSTALLVVAAIDYLIPGPSHAMLKIGISVLFIILLNLIALFGIQASAIITMLLTMITIGVLLAFIFPGLFKINYDYYFPFYVFGGTSLFVTIFYLAESFFGWEGATYLAEETQNPQKIIPKALIMGTIIVGLLGTGITVVSLGVLPWKILASSNIPLTLISDVLLGDVGMKLLNVGIFISLIGSAAGGIITMPRLILALARDKLFISQFSEIHYKFQTPYKAIIFQTIVSLLVFAMAFGRYHSLLDLLLPMGFVLYFFVIFSVLILRKKEPNIKREYKVPFARIGSLVLMTFISLILLSWLYPAFDFSKINSATFAIAQLGLSLILVGIPIYFLLQIYYDPDVIILINDALAYFTLLTEKILLPKSIRNEILTLLGNIKGKRVLEFGCSVGTLTVHLAESVKPEGRIYATDLSIRDLSITKKRLIRRGHTHVVVIHDEHQVNRVHPSIPHVDAVVSIGMMGYLQDVKKVLKEMRDLLPYGGKIIFVDYVDFFKIIPNVAWLSDNKKIETIFKDAGFSVFVTRKRGLFWNYVFVHGIKFHENVPYI